MRWRTARTSWQINSRVMIAETDIRTKSIRGLNVSFIFMGLTSLIILLRKVVLARLLLPSDFGLFAFTILVVVFVNNLASLRMQDVIVQTRTDPKRMLNTAFSCQLAVSIPMFIIVLAFAGFISRGLHKPEMATYLRVASLFILTIPFALPRALFLKTIDIFKVKLPIALGLAGNTVICIVMAVRGFGVWSLITGYVLDSVINVIIIWSYSPHKPRLEFDRKIFKEILRFSLPLYFLTLLIWIFWQGDDFIVGLVGDRTLFLAGNAALGFYSLAFYFPHQLMRIRSEMAGVSFPAFSAIRNDIRRLNSAYSTITRNSAIFMLSFGAVLIPLARPTILYLLGEKWLPSVNAFRIFMIAAMVRAIFANWGEVYKSLGKTRALLWAYIPSPVLLLLLGPYVTLKFGMLGMSLLIMGIILAMQPLVIYLTKRVLVEVSFTKLLWKPLVVFAIVLSATSGVCRFVSNIRTFLASAVALFLCYYLLMAIFDRQFRLTALDYLRVSFTKGVDP